MLLWQLKNVRNRHVLWLKLLACSFTAHLFFVGILFFGYRDGVSSHKFTMHSNTPNRQVTVVLAPTVHKPVANGAPVKQTTLAQNMKSVQHNKAATRVATLKPTQIKTVAKKAVPTKVVPAKKVATKIAPVKTVTAKKVPVKPIPAKAVPVKTVQTKTEKPKVVQAPVLEQKKPAVAKAVADKPEVVAKSVEQKIEAPLALAQQTIAQPAVAEALADKPEHVLTYEQSNVSTQIEIPYTQAREFYQQEALRKEISKHWKPPHGIPDTCTGEITTYVGNNGVITDSVITQSSGILMYDVSARAAILASELPRWTWGTSFTITFKQ